MLSLLFVGAGPHCLTTLLRVLEPHPDASIDEPFRAATPKAKVLRYWHRQRTCPTYRAALRAWLAEHVAVVDPAGCWMARWSQQFSGLGISHLRSTTAVHPDPLETYALATFSTAAASLAQQQPVLPLKHIDKSRHFRGPFSVPGADLFESFVADAVHRYCCADVVVQDRVVRLTPVRAAAGEPAAAATASTPVSHWVVELASGRQLTARRVVVGIGSTNVPRVPEALHHLQPVAVSRATPAAGSSLSDSVCCSTDGCDGGCSDSSGWSWSSSETAAAACEDCGGGSSSSSSSCSSTHKSPARCLSQEVLESLSRDAADQQKPEQQQHAERPETAADARAATAASDWEPAMPVSSYPAGRMLHAWELVQATGSSTSSTSSAGSSRTAAAARRLLDAGLLLPGEDVLIIGGGLTSVHLASLAATAQQCGSITLLLRGGLRVKQFDVDVPWMGRHRKQQLQQGFKSLKMSERAKALKRALQGGSVPPEGAAVLHQLQQAGRLQLREHAELLTAEWDARQQRWDVWLQDGSVLHPHRLWLATGSTVSATADPLMLQLLQELPIPVTAGLPAIQPSLEWQAGAGLYMLGAFAALQLGPGALNLAGAKTASVVVSPRLGSSLLSRPPAACSL